MHFQGTPLRGEYDTSDGFVRGWEGCEVGRPSGVGLVGVFYTRLSIVVDGGELGILKACCFVSSLDRRFLSWWRSHFTSVVSPMR